MIKRPIFALLGAVAFASLSLAPAAALNARTWVSGTGVDQAGCGPIANPCRSLQYAHDNTSAGGEIDVRDSAGYGSLVITKAITILGDGSIAGVLASANADAIAISAGSSDDVLLKGLTIEGANVGNHGILFTAGGSLVVANCVVRGFSADGVYIRPTSGVPTISLVDDILSNNGSGFTYNPTSGTAAAKLLLARVVADGNTVGVEIVSANQTGGLVDAQVNDAIVSNNSAAGITGNQGYRQTTPATIILDNARVFNNGKGVLGNSATILVSHSVISGNPIGVSIGWAGSIKTYGDNRIDGNGTDVSGGTLVSVSLK